MLAPRTSEAGVVPLVKRVVDNVEHLVSTHLELVRSELKEDARELAGQVGKVLACVPVIGAGLIVLLTGIAILLGTETIVPMWGAFLIVGVGSMLLGGLTLYTIVRRMRAPEVLDDTREELKSSATAIAQDAKALTGGDDVH